MKVLLIPVEGHPGEVDLADGRGTRFVRSLRALIGARCVERIWITDRWEAWADEDGAAAERPVNQAATLLARSFGAQFSLLGATVIVGLDKSHDRPVGLSQDQIATILRRITDTP